MVSVRIMNAKEQADELAKAADKVAPTPSQEVQDVPQPSRKTVAGGRPSRAVEGAVRGRPRKWESAEGLQTALDEYFALCDAGKPSEVVSQGRVVKYNERIPYTVTGLCIVLDCQRSTLIEYGDGKYDDVDPDFSNIVKKAKLKVLDQIEHNLYNGKPAAGAIFSLKNNNGWRDKTEWEGELTGNMSVETVNYAGAAPDLREPKRASDADDDEN